MNDGFFNDLLAALDALPSRRLIDAELDNGVDCCALGAMLRHRGIEVPEDDDTAEVAAELGVDSGLAFEVVNVNDHSASETPEDRFIRVRAWAEECLRTEVR
jgi:hypothetical protein